MHESLTALQNVKMGLELHPEISIAEMNERSSEMLALVGLGERVKIGRAHV